MVKRRPDGDVNGCVITKMWQPALQKLGNQKGKMHLVYKRVGPDSSSAGSSSSKFEVAPVL